MNNRTVKIVFKDNTCLTFEAKAMWLNDIIGDTKHAIALKLTYILDSHSQKDYSEDLIILTENIKYIRIIDKPDKVEKEHKDEN